MSDEKQNEISVGGGEGALTENKKKINGSFLFCCFAHRELLKFFSPPVMSQDYFSLGPSQLQREACIHAADGCVLRVIM